MPEPAKGRDIMVSSLSDTWINVKIGTGREKAEGCSLKAVRREISGVSGNDDGGGSGPFDLAHGTPAPAYRA